MTLLELLRQELPKRGGWPEGAERARQDADREICFEGESGSRYDFYVGKMSDDSLRRLNKNNRATSDLYVTREQYESTESPHRLHPLRTEAECAIDEMVRLSGVSIGAAKILYDAGYRKG